MRMSCNGCRVLRKGCSDDCSIRPCLQWIKSPESQANATVFLAKFYGRAGLMNLINAGPDHLRPAIFRSLLYEACGRMVNPIYGSVGLLWSGSWQLCQAAVEAVLKGAPIVQISSESAANAPVPFLLNKACSYDIRHVSKAAAGHPSAAANDLHKVNKATRPRFKRPGNHDGCGHHTSGTGTRLGSPETEPAAEREPGRRCYPVDSHRAASDDSSASQASGPDSAGEREDRGSPPAADHRDGESTFSEDTAEASMVTCHGAEAGKPDGLAPEDGEVELELELTLGLGPAHHSPRSSTSSGGGSHRRRHIPSANAAIEPVRSSAWGREMCSADPELDLAA